MNVNRNFPLLYLIFKIMERLILGEKRLSSIRIVTCDDDISALNSVKENGSSILKRTNKHTQGIYCGPYAMREKTILLFSQYYLLEVKTQPLICFGK